ncbi:hypothetical protein M427DRAFT_321236 [Gonapodya prolifera JEL478]|uniref:MYND-type domain-containing protein n=1 Tax=Gonapodya prolifera (strain JEL478) TaxID=1344416 RepID=A0A139AH29_GONPJ|nr:hypothetical protein M427DRAFT_321236 [Gonapodya prolifera JEL478]|eukprot:KXS15745.1 hypothetical protein M427DRAFT_321236 [Gonapodya prolifera JEL478]
MIWSPSARRSDAPNLEPKNTCARCQIAMYCDVTCQKAHWKSRCAGRTFGAWRELRRSRIQIRLRNNNDSLSMLNFVVLRVIDSCRVIPPPP